MKNKSRQMAFSPPAGLVFGKLVNGSIDHHLPGLSSLYGFVFFIFESLFYFESVLRQDRDAGSPSSLSAAHVAAAMSAHAAASHAAASHLVCQGGGLGAVYNECAAVELA